MNEKFEGGLQPEKDIINVVSVEEIKNVTERSNFVYRGNLYHKLNESFVVKVKTEDQKFLGDGTALLIEDIDKETEG